MAKITKSILVEEELWERFKIKCFEKKLIMGDVVGGFIIKFLEKK